MQKRLLAILLVLPALIMIVLFFIVPLFASVVGAFEVGGTMGLGNFTKSFELYSSDMIFTRGDRDCFDGPYRSLFHSYRRISYPR